MYRVSIVLLIVALGCRACPIGVSPQIEAQVAALAPVPAVSDGLPCPAAQLVPAEESFDLPQLWKLALANNPFLREAAADVEVARGRLIVATKYPNPRFLAEDESLGTRAGPGGTVRLQLNQEIVAAGKRRLDRAIATRGTDAATVALLGRKFEVLTRIRRAYFDYLGWEHTSKVHAQNVEALQKGVAIAEKALKQAGVATRVDLLRLQALLDQARVDQERSQINASAAWRRLAAEIGMPHLPKPKTPAAFPNDVPRWDLPIIDERVFSANTELRQMTLESERARLEIERAQAEAMPNVSVGGGYSRSFFEKAAGAIVSFETPVPLWDRKQGQIHEAQARWARAQAAERATANRLRQDSAEAFSRYEGARRQAQRLQTDVLPRLEESLDDVLKRYQGGAAQAFTDVLLAEQAVNDTRVKLADTHRELWRAVADLQGLMQLDLDEELFLATAP
jgi:cobalt-zinc-cadmium efflux system outer membrane protein